MELQLVSKEVAILAKELGFDLRVAYWYPEEGEGLYPENGAKANINSSKEFISAPEQELLAKWLRDVHKLYVYCWPKPYIEEIVWTNVLANRDGKTFLTYEEAMEEGLNRSLLFLKDRIDNTK